MASSSIISPKQPDGLKFVTRSDVVNDVFKGVTVQEIIPFLDQQIIDTQLKLKKVKQAHLLAQLPFDFAAGTIGMILVANLFKFTFPPLEQSHEWTDDSYKYKARWIGFPLLTVMLLGILVCSRLYRSSRIPNAVKQREKLKKLRDLRYQVSWKKGIVPPIILNRILQIPVAQDRMVELNNEQLSQINPCYLKGLVENKKLSTLPHSVASLAVQLREAPVENICLRVSLAFTARYPVCLEIALNGNHEVMDNPDRRELLLRCLNRIVREKIDFEQPCEILEKGIQLLCNGKKIHVVLQWLINWRQPDVLIEYGSEQKIRANKERLANLSPVFHQLFDNFRTKTLRREVEDPELFEQMIMYMEFGIFQTEDIVRLYALASEYQVDCLIEKCLQGMIEEVEKISGESIDHFRQKEGWYPSSPYGIKEAIYYFNEMSCYRNVDHPVFIEYFTEKFKHFWGSHNIQFNYSLVQKVYFLEKTVTLAEECCHIPLQKAIDSNRGFLTADLIKTLESLPREMEIGTFVSIVKHLYPFSSDEDLTDTLETFVVEAVEKVYKSTKNVQAFLRKLEEESQNIPYLREILTSCYYYNEMKDALEVTWPNGFPKLVSSPKSFSV